VTEFETAAMVGIHVEDGSLRSARDTIEDRLPDRKTVGVTPVLEDAGLAGEVEAAVEGADATTRVDPVVQTDRIQDQLDVVEASVQVDGEPGRAASGRSTVADGGAAIAGADAIGELEQQTTIQEDILDELKDGEFGGDGAGGGGLPGLGLGLGTGLLSGLAGRFTDTVRRFAKRVDNTLERTGDRIQRSAENAREGRVQRPDRGTDGRPDTSQSDTGRGSDSTRTDPGRFDTTTQGTDAGTTADAGRGDTDTTAEPERSGDTGRVDAGRPSGRSRFNSGTGRIGGRISGGPSTAGGGGTAPTRVPGSQRTGGLTDDAAKAFNKLTGGRFGIATDAVQGSSRRLLGALPIAAAAFDAAEVAGGAQRNGLEGATQEAGGVALGAPVAAAGAFGGSVLGPAGTLGGAVLGGFAGDAIGDAVTGEALDFFEQFGGRELSPSERRNRFSSVTGSGVSSQAFTDEGETSTFDRFAQAAGIEPADGRDSFRPSVRRGVRQRLQEIGGEVGSSRFREIVTQERQEFRQRFGRGPPESTQSSTAPSDVEINPEVTVNIQEASPEQIAAQTGQNVRQQVHAEVRRFFNSGRADTNLGASFAKEF